MNQLFITKIDILNSKNLHNRHIENLTIDLSGTERMHLIITGKNGSGKTSFLAHLSNLLLRIDTDPGYLDRFSNKDIHIFFSLNSDSYSAYRNGNFIKAYFTANRHNRPETPQGIKAVNLNSNANINDKIGKYFVQYIVNMRANQSFARDDGDEKEVERIIKWFTKFQDRLKYIFDSPDIELEFDRSQYNFNILDKDREPFTFQNLSAGYSAIISITTEILMRMEANNAQLYDLQGIVLIDEIETHLHVDLQKKILPFLIDFFPNIQFIVTTHSPFVLSSIEKAKICDFEKLIVTEDLSGYSYETILESYFGTDKYSQILKEKIKLYEQLSLKECLSDDDSLQLLKLESELDSLPKYLAPELALKIQQIKLTQLDRKKRKENDIR